LEPIGYTRGFSSYDSVNSHCGSSNPSIGNPVFARGAPLTSSTERFSYPSQDGTGNINKHACRYMSSSHAYWACSTHLSPDRDVAELQARESHQVWWVGTGKSNTATIYQGDFNIVHNPGGGVTSLGISYWWFSAEEMHLPTQVTTHIHLGNPEKIDFGFASRNKYTRTSVDSSCSILGASDHRYCVGHFAF
jgi:hypothetical protein